MAFTQVAVSGAFRLPDGSVAAGQVHFTPSAPMRNDSSVVQAPVIATLDALGQVSTTLYATDDPGTSPTGVSYLVQERIKGVSVVRSYYLEVPFDGGPIDLDTVAVAELAPAVVAYLTQAAGDARYEPLGGSTAAAARSMAAAMALVLS